MANGLKLEIITPSRRVMETEAEWVTVPGIEGEMGILPDHLPVVTSMDSGILQYHQDGNTGCVAVHYGYAQVRGNLVTVLSEMAEQSHDIDPERARDAERRAREALQDASRDAEASEHRLNRLEAKLRRALVRQQASR